MEKKRKLLLIGDSAFAEIAFEYFQHDSDTTSSRSAWSSSI